MKTLYLLRHAKSSWSNPALIDFDRPLNERGKRDVVEMGKRLKAKNILPAHIIASPAKRTRQTAKRIAKQISFDKSKIEYNKSIYHCHLKDMLRETCAINDSFNEVIMVGHNYTIAEFCDYLCNFSHPFPTCCIACITFDVDSWQEISGKTGTLSWIDFPKNN